MAKLVPKNLWSCFFSETYVNCNAWAIISVSPCLSVFFHPLTWICKPTIRARKDQRATPAWKKQNVLPLKNLKKNNWNAQIWIMRCSLFAQFFCYRCRFHHKHVKIMKKKKQKQNIRTSNHVMESCTIYELPCGWSTLLQVESLFDSQKQFVTYLQASAKSVQWSKVVSSFWAWLSSHWEGKTHLKTSIVV